MRDGAKIRIKSHSNIKEAVTGLGDDDLEKKSRNYYFRSMIEFKLLQIIVDYTKNIIFDKEYHEKLSLIPPFENDNDDEQKDDDIDDDEKNATKETI